MDNQVYVITNALQPQLEIHTLPPIVAAQLTPTHKLPSPHSTHTHNLLICEHIMFFSQTLCFSVE